MKRSPKPDFVKKSFSDYIMGMLWIGVGLFLLFGKYFGWEWIAAYGVVVMVYGALCVMYGLWRVYRGYRRDRISG